MDKEVDIKAGDIVQLKTGDGPYLVVARVYPETKKSYAYAYCIRFSRNNDAYASSSLSLNVLKRVELSDGRP